MANSFTSARDPGAVPVRMSNGRTAVVFDTVAIAGCARARTDWERAAMLWLIEHDQTLIGLGMAGFDVGELGWTAEGFREQHAFLVAVLDDAASGVGWERLPFEPGEGVAPVIRELRDLVSRFTSAMIVDGGPRDLPARAGLHRVQRRADRQCTGAAAALDCAPMTASPRGRVGAGDAGSRWRCR